MASVFIGYNQGQDLSPDNATEGAATGSTDVEVRIDTTKFTTRMDTIQILRAIVRYLEDGRVSVLPL